MSVNYERGNIVRDGYTTVPEVEAQNRYAMGMAITLVL